MSICSDLADKFGFLGKSRELFPAIRQPSAKPDHGPAKPLAGRAVGAARGSPGQGENSLGRGAIERRRIRPGARGSPPRTGRVLQPFVAATLAKSRGKMKNPPAGLEGRLAGEVIGVERSAIEGRPFGSTC
ncbi:MAG: hypothetical protein EHM77_09080 [Planctomycetaceae bacterium]|nr:MAG: hypothetical protein EHM77_09080 [Planctomycetaceae bacterium]